MKELTLKSTSKLHLPNWNMHYGIKAGKIVVAIEEELEKALNAVKKFSTRDRRLSVKTLNPGERYYVGDGMYVRHGKTDDIPHKKRR